MQKYDEACSLVDSGDYEEAEKYLEEILSEDSQHYASLNKLGTIKANYGQLDLAKNYFVQALSINPDYAPALVNLGNILLEGGDLSGAEAKYRLAMEKDENYHLSYHNLAIIYKRKGQYNEYIKHIKKYSRLNKLYIKEIEKIEGQKVKKRLGCIMSIILALIVSALTLIPIFL